MKNYIEIISYSLSALIALVSLVSVFLTSYKSKLKGKENKSKDEQLEEAKSNIESLTNNYSILSKISQIVEYIPTAMVESEKLNLTNGTSKKIYALSLIMLKCNELGLDYKNCAKMVSEKIENLISFSKEVNVKKEE